MKVQLTITLILWLTSLCLGQNLIPNPSFENHASLDCTTCYSSKTFLKVVPPWKAPGMKCILMTRNYEANYLEKERGWGGNDLVTLLFKDWKIK